MVEFIPTDNFIESFSRAEVESMLKHGQIIMRRCHVCDEPQFALPEVVRAWDEEVAFECLCQSCLWRLEQ